MIMRMFASDLDGTLLPLPETETRAAARLVSEVNSLLCSTECLTVYATGRHLSLALDGISEVGIGQPDFFVTDVGTSIYRRNGDQWILEERYVAVLRREWTAQNRADLAELLGEFSELSLQEPEKQSEFKLSYDVAPNFLGENAHSRNSLTELRHRLDLSGIPHRLISSLDPYGEKGLIDLLPPSASKYLAVSTVAEINNISLQDVLYAGDSGNDLEVFTSGIHSIVVDNTSADVKKIVQDFLEKQESKSGREASKPLVYFAQACATAGVLEGIKYFRASSEVG